MTNINNCILRFRLYFEPFIKLNCLIIIYTFYNIKIQLMDIPIVCAPGSANIKMGFAGDNFPRCSLASVVGRPNMHINSHLSMEDVIIGNKAIKERSLLQLYSPISYGSVRDWEEMKILLKHSFKEIGVKDPRGKSIFIASPIQNSYLNKIEMMDLMFEQFGANRIQFGLQPLMTLFSEGNDTGVVIDIGYSSTRLTKIFEGDILGFENVKIGGLHVVDNFLNLLYQRGYSSRINLDFYTAKQLMQKQCFVAVDLNLEKKIAFQTCIHEKKYILPDKQVIKMGMQRFLAPQILFNFKDKQLEAKGCGDMIVNSIHNSTFYNNIILSGGTSMIPGLSTRLKQDIQLRLKQKYQIEYTKTTINKIRIIDAPNRNDNVFLGCSLIAKETKDFNKAWISKHQYEQKGKTRLAQELCSSLK